MSSGRRRQCGTSTTRTCRPSCDLRWRRKPLTSSPSCWATARERALTAEEADQLAEALRRHQPWLEWSGKREKPWFEVDPVPLHMHERVSTQAILRVLARQDVQRDLFADPQHDYAKAVQFYPPRRRLGQPHDPGRFASGDGQPRPA